jgi:hypothetical protein
VQNASHKKTPEKSRQLSTVYRTFCMPRVLPPPPEDEPILSEHGLDLSVTRGNICRHLLERSCCAALRPPLATPGAITPTLVVSKYKEGAACRHVLPWPRKQLPVCAPPFRVRTEPAWVAATSLPRIHVASEEGDGCLIGVARPSPCRPDHTPSTCLDCSRLYTVSGEYSMWRVHVDSMLKW